MANLGPTAPDADLQFPIGAIALYNRFTTFKESLQWAHGLDGGGSTGNAKNYYHFDTSASGNATAWESSREDLLAVITKIEMAGQQFLHDTSLGGNEAINPFWSFTRDDDIVPRMYASGDGAANTNKGDPVRGMGRVYYEMYHNTGQMLHLIMGSPNYSGIGGYLTKMGGDNLGAALFGADGGGMLKKIGRSMAGFGGFLLIQLPLIPLHGFMTALRFASDFGGVSKFVSFSPNMSVYYRMVNTILHELAAGMGIGVSEWDKDASASTKRIHNIYEAIGYPRIMREGLDIITILSRRFRRQNRGTNIAMNLDDLIFNSDDDGGLGSTIDDVINAIGINRQDTEEMSNKRYKTAQEHLAVSSQGNVRTISSPNSKFVNAALGGFQYVSFRVTANDNSSHSISNQIGESSYGAEMNQKSASATDERVTPGFMSTLFAPLRAAVNLGRAAKKAIISGAGFTAISDAMYNSGFHDIPEIWRGAQFSKSYSFNMTLKAPLGDNVSVMQAEYVPLALLMAAAFPRQINSGMYTAPFYVRGYCKGQFAITLGIIESMTITPGSSGRNWSIGMLPTSVDVNFVIRDLSPIVAMGIAGDVLDFLNILDRNTAMHEYLATMSGIGFRERFNLLPQIKRSVTSRWASLKTTYSPSNIMAKLGMSTVGQVIGNFLPTSEIISRN